MKIKMLVDVMPDNLPGIIIYDTNMVLHKGNIYEAKQNKHGAVYVTFENGQSLGVKTDEFEVIRN